MSRSVVITGASTGIGRDCAEYLGNKGWRVFAGTRTREEAQQVDVDMPSVTAIHLDVTDAACVAAAAARVTEELGDAPLTGVVNNAAISVDGPLEYLPIDAVRDVFEVNVFGVVRVTQAFVPLLRRGPGRIVNIGSSAAGFSIPLAGPYCASKAAMQSIMESFRRELDHFEIWTCMVAPGPVATSIWDRVDSALEDLLERLPPEGHERYGELIERFRKLSRRNEAKAIPPRVVTETVEQALTAKTPFQRYDPGRHAKVSRAIVHNLPGPAADWLLKLVMR